MTDDIFFPPQHLMENLWTKGGPWLGGHLCYLFAVSIYLRAKEVLELGTGYPPIGNESMLAFLPALAFTGGRLVTIDLVDCVDAKKAVENADMKEHVVFLQGDDLTIDVEGPFDLIFLDSSKEANHTEEELKRFGPMLRPGGHFVCHDTADAQYVGYRDVIVRWAEENGWPWREYTHSYGLFVMRRPNAR